MNLQYGNYKLIYRRYAGLYFMVGVDTTEEAGKYLFEIFGFDLVTNFEIYCNYFFQIYGL